MELAHASSIVVLSWSLRSAATLGLLALLSRGPESFGAALLLAAAALVVAALAVKTTGAHTA